MVKVGGKQKSQKACTKHGNFTKSGGGKFGKVGGNERFGRNRGELDGKNENREGKISNLWSMTKKGHQKLFWRMKIEIFSRKR